MDGEFEECLLLNDNFQIINLTDLLIFKKITEKIYCWNSCMKSVKIDLKNSGVESVHFTQILNSNYFQNLFHICFFLFSYVFHVVFEKI